MSDTLVLLLVGYSLTLRGIPRIMGAYDSTPTMENLGLHHVLYSVHSQPPSRYPCVPAS